MGGSPYRAGGASGPTDTVYLGAFRTDDLLAVGGWDERFPTNQDFDLNRRLGSDGAVWFDASLRSGYLPAVDRSGAVAAVPAVRSWKVRYWRPRGDAPSGGSGPSSCCPVSWCWSGS